MSQAVAQSQASSSFLQRVPTTWLYLAVIIVMAIAMALTAASAASEGAAEAAAEGTEYTFTLEDVYIPWGWIVLIGVFVISMINSLKRNWPFASTIQISLIIALLVCFAMIAQQFDRDFYRVGSVALIFLTLIQIAFGNISPQANFAQSMRGLLITAVILAFVVALSIWLVPFLIQLGRPAN
jgi:hypothetical protein